MRVTIKDIAHKAGVDPGAVSRTLRNDPQAQRLRPETRERIRRIAAELGYRPNLLARSLKTGKSHIIGLVGFSLQNEVNAPAVVHLTSELLAYNYTTQMVYDRAEADLRLKACCSLIDQGCDALIISGELDDKISAALAAMPVPVFLLTPYENPQFQGRMVRYDYAVGCQAALEELFQLGHRHIFYVGMNWNRWREDVRYQVFQKFITEKCGKLAEADYLYFPPDLEDITEQSLRTFLTQHPEITAFVVPGDIAAMKLVQLLTQLNLRVPEDISVIGFDDIATAEYYTPSLSTVRKDVAGAAREIAKLAMNVLEGKNFPVQHSVACNFIKRQSIASVRDSVLKFNRKEN